MTEPTLPRWLIEAGEQFTDTWVPLTRMPGVPGPVKVSITGLLAGAYLAGWNDASAQFADGIPAGAKVLTPEEWNALRDALWKATGWRQSTDAEPVDDYTLQSTRAVVDVARPDNDPAPADDEATQ